MRFVLFFAAIAAFGQEGGALPAPQAPPVPQCDSYSIQTLPTLHWKQKTCIWRDQLITGNALTGAAFWGAVAEWRHTPPEWPQGFKGFGMQMGTRYAQGMTKSTAAFLVGGLLHEDPRPRPAYEIGCEHQHFRATGVWPRVGQSLLRVVWTHKENCHDAPAFSRLAGAFASGFVQMGWQPDRINNVSTALRGSAGAMGGYFGYSVFTEFQGDLYGLVGKLFTTGKPKP